jgi:hypothetical protein
VGAAQASWTLDEGPTAKAAKKATKSGGEEDHA